MFDNPYHNWQHAFDVTQVACGTDTPPGRCWHAIHLLACTRGIHTRRHACATLHVLCRASQHMVQSKVPLRRVPARA